MSFCTNDILLLASGIYLDINSPSSQSVGMISGWVTDPNNLGGLNNQLSSSFYITGSCIEGGFGAEEGDIYGQIYSAWFYYSKGQAALDGGGSFWTRIAEGDASVSRASAAEVAKAYFLLGKQTQDALRLAIHDYKLRLSVPQSVDSASLFSSPTP